jgi:hypothetical protein
MTAGQLSKDATPNEIVLKHKLSVFKDFLLATASLKAALLSQDMKQVGDMLKRRQELMGFVDKLDTRLTNVASFSPDVKTLSEGLAKAIAEVINANEECVAIAARFRTDLGKELHNINDVRVALRGYGGRNIPRPSRLFSVKA